ncbi:hypothetical protein Tco_0146147, partial [Tanacetum coccineum]
LEVSVLSDVGLSVPPKRRCVCQLNSASCRVQSLLTSEIPVAVDDELKTPYGFEMDFETLCVSKKGNLGDRKTFCISSEANGQSRHSKASLIATCSDYIVNSRHISCTSSNINCPTKEATAHQHLMDHVCVQPEKAVVLSECPLQKKVAAKVNSSKKQQAQANDQKTCMVQTDVVKALEKAKEGSKGTMEWAKEKMKKGYEATKVRAVEGLEAEKERSDVALDKFYSKIKSHPSELQQQTKGSKFAGTKLLI